MARTSVGYIGVDHHHRDPYFEIAERLPIEITSICEPGKEYTAADIRPLADRPDEITSEGADVQAIAEQATIYAEPAEMIAAENLDVLWVTFANRDVPGIISTAIDEGIDVISEKPLARTAGELRPVAEKTREAGVTVGATYFYRANPVAVAFRDYVADGRFGDIWSVDGRYIGSTLAYRDTDHYIYDEAVSRGGVLQWLGLHWIDLFMWILDEPIVRVSAQAQDAPTGTGDIEEGLTMLFETESGIMGTFQTGYYLGEKGKDTRIGIYGEHATASSPVHHNGRADEEAVPLTITADSNDWAGAPRRTVNYEFGYNRFSSWGDYVLDFFSDFFEGRGTETGVPATVDDALAVLEVLDAVYEAVETNQWVAVENR